MSERPRYPRSTCCIVGCPRWSTLFPGEWLCAEHWRMVPKAWRAVLRRVWKREALAIQVQDTAPSRMNWVAARNAHRAGWRLWDRAKRHVTQKAAGL